MLVENRDVLLIGQGKNYATRKQALNAYVQALRTKQLRGAACPPPFDWLYHIGLAVTLTVSHVTPRQIAEVRPLACDTSTGALMIEGS